MSVTVRIKFGRKGPVRYLGHLDMMRYFQKAVMRSGIPARYTEGFHPHQIMSFAYPLGVSMETEGDYMDLDLIREEDPEELVKRLNAVMREGIFAVSAVLLPEKAPNAMASVAAADYLLEIRKKDGDCPGADRSLHRDGEADRNGQMQEPPGEEDGLSEMLRAATDKILARESITVGEKEKEIRPGICFLKAEGRDIRMRLSSGSRLNVRPADVWDCMVREEGGLSDAELSKILRLEIYGMSEDGSLLPLDRLYRDAPEKKESDEETAVS